MKNDPQTKMLFNSERAKKLAAKLLGFMEGVRADPDLGYIANTIKTINLILENRDLFCTEVLNKNISFLPEHLLLYVTGKEDIH